MATTTFTGRSINPPPPGALPSLPMTPQTQTARPDSSALPSRPPRPIANTKPSLSLKQPSTTCVRPGAGKGPPKKHHMPAPPQQSKTLRKTTSVGAFPQPPKGPSRTNSNGPSPSSAAAASVASLPDGLPTNRRSSSTSLSVPNGDTTMRTRSASAKSRQSLLRSPHAMSTPETRTPSAQGSQSQSVDTPTNDGSGAHDAGQDSADKSSSETKGNVVVSVRVRPQAGTADDVNHGDWELDGRRGAITYSGKEGGQFVSDNVFTANDNNAKVYDSAAKRLVRRVMEGYHGTVFAYGMTGTGKTFSMQGTASSPGVIPLAITDIFSFIRETPQREFLLRVSYLEIYNEKINDLLSPPPPTGPGMQAVPQEEIKLREDSKRGVYATPLKEEIVQSPNQLLRVIARGDNSRRVAGTQFNARSSRSHAVVQIVVESRERVPGGSSLQENKRAATIVPGGVLVSTLSLIDLAGSERAADSKERRTEGAHINKSLLTLGTVIARLSESKGKEGAERDKHLPYRDSKLTRLLQPALSGNSLVSILCTISIGSTGSAANVSTHINETLNTLKFASRAKNSIVSHAKKAEEANAGGDAGSRALLDRYRNEIQELRKQLEAKTKEEASAKDAEEEKAREAEEKARHEEQMLELQLARTALKERIEHLNRLILSSKSFGVNNPSRSFSGMGSHYRNSVVSTNEGYAVSVRSSRASELTLEVPPHLNRTSSGGSALSLSLSSHSNGLVGEHGSEDNDSLGENGDGTASASAQIRALHADLADKNRYIITLEKRLLQARRSSQPRASILMANGGSDDGEGGVEAVLKEKDEEIAELRARLDDKDRMLNALRSAARKRDIADLKVDTSVERTRAQARRSAGSTSSSVYTRPSAAAMSPAYTLSPGSEKRMRNVEDATRTLNGMITERVEKKVSPVDAK
ncbi:kinesin motor domain-containing protein [Phyllosticta citrichinensis]|uniref:Kinesin-like protein n=1 Tax=Phyllosticta citrichinensis TaxID=1130410 RepID=A0ABR1Y5P7_9PEZI